MEQSLVQVQYHHLFTNILRIYLQLHPLARNHRLVWQLHLLTRSHYLVRYRKVLDCSLIYPDYALGHLFQVVPLDLVGPYQPLLALDRINQLVVALQVDGALLHLLHFVEEGSLQPHPAAFRLLFVVVQFKTELAQLLFFFQSELLFGQFKFLLEMIERRQQFFFRFLALTLQKAKLLLFHGFSVPHVEDRQLRQIAGAIDGNGLALGFKRIPRNIAVDDRDRHPEGLLLLPHRLVAPVFLYLRCHQ